MTPVISLLLALAASPTPVDTTLCAIVRNPGAFSSRVVRFRAGVHTDWHHGTVLVHSGCEGGIQLASTDVVQVKQSEALDNAVGSPMDGGYNRTAMATFTGRVSWHPAKQQAPFDNPLKLDAHVIEQIKVYPRRQPR